MFTYEEFRVCIHAFLCLYTRFFARIHAAPLQKNRVSLQSPALTDDAKVADALEKKLSKTAGSG